MKDSTKDINSLKAENSDLKLELLRWRKKVSIYRLKLASVEEDAKMYQDNLTTLAAQVSCLTQEKQELESRAGALAGQLRATAQLHAAQQCDMSKQQVGSSLHS